MKRLIACLLMVAGQSFAGDASQFTLIGFSKDGTHVAFERYGYHDGSGFPWSEIFIVETEENDYAVPPSYATLSSEQEESGEFPELLTIRENHMLQMAPVLKKYGIVKGNRGTDVFDPEVAKPGLFSFHHGNDEFTLTLDQTETDRECLPAGNARKMKLTITSGFGAMVLQEDQSIPQSRGCPFYYSLAGVFCYKSYVAVFVSYDSPGFEGPDTRQIIVTGFLP